MLFQVELMCTFLVAYWTYELRFDTTLKLLVAVERPSHTVALAAALTGVHQSSVSATGCLHHWHTNRSPTTGATGKVVVVVVVPVVAME